MNIRTRHMALLAYSGLTAIIVVKDVISDPIQIVGLLAPIIALCSWDKYQSNHDDSSRGE